MTDVNGDNSSKYSKVANWSAEFKRGQFSLENDPSLGCPADVISQEMIDQAKMLVLSVCESKLPNFKVLLL